MKEVKGLLKEIHEEIKKNNSFPHNDCHDVEHLFPAHSLRDIDTFLVDDVNLEKRKRGLYNLLLTTPAPNEKAFRRGLFARLFTRKFIKSTRWPSKE